MQVIPPTSVFHQATSATGRRLRRGPATLPRRSKHRRMLARLDPPPTGFSDSWEGPGRAARGCRQKPIPVDSEDIAHKDRTYAAQEPSFYSRPDSAAASGTNGDGFVYGASPHRRLPGAVPAHTC